jgi:protein-disulfide isomerase
VTEQLEHPRLTVDVGPDDHVRGARVAPLTLVEYGDYECPYCGAAHPVVEDVRAELGDTLRFVFRHFPLTTVHPHALPAAEAAEAAGAQGRFWPMHDLLYDDQRDLEVTALIRRASKLGLDVDRFESELLGHAYRDRIQDNFVSGVHSGVQGTPTFFVNGVRHDGAWDRASLVAALRPPAPDTP